MARTRNVSLLTLPVSALLLISPPAFGAQYDYTPEGLQRSYESYTAKKIAGFCMLGFGLATTGTAIGLMASADWTSQSSATGTTVTTSDPAGGAGLIMVFTGPSIVVLGSILAARGSRKARYYKGLMSQMEIGPVIGKDKAGLAMRVRF